jgi:autotransporter-associated beta strand protein
MRKFHLVLAGLLGAALSSLAAESGYDRPMGPIGGYSRLTGGQNYVRVSAMPTNTAGYAAGLRVNDYIHGAFGDEFGVTTPGDSVWDGTGFQGAVQDLGLAIERAEAGDGNLPLKVMRSGAGELNIVVTLNGTNGLGPAYPLNSPKFNEWYEIACSNLHVQLMNGNGNIGYYTPYAALALMGHPGALQTNGPTPYRLSLNKVRDMVVPALNACTYAPVEDTLMDGTSNPNAALINTNVMSNWELGPRTMFLAEYVALTGDTSVMPTLQRATEVCANCIQWWNQGLNYPTNYIWNAGHTGHGGVTGDYATGSQGMNVTGLQMISGMALASRVGVDMTARPRDGHYFGYSTCPPGAVMSGLENYDWTLAEKLMMHWDASAKSSGNYWGADEMWVGYCAGYGTAEDTGTRTPATLFSIAAYYGDTSGLDADRQERIRRLKNWVSRHYWVQNNTHVCLQPGPMWQQMASAYISPRQQRYYMDNWRFYYTMTRLTSGAAIPYFPGRGSSDAGCYLSNETGTLLNFAYALSVARGLPNVPGYTTNQILAYVKSPFLTWPSEAAKYAKVTNSVQPVVVDICDGLGTPLAGGSYSANWTFVSGPATATFSDPNSASTTVTFPVPGRYRIQLAAASGTNSVTEPIDIDAAFGTAPAGFVLGYVGYDIYTGIGGNNVSDLTNAAKYPNYPDTVGTLTSLDSTYSGDNYGQRIRGFIIPPATGSYKFFLASDDASQLKFSASGTNPAAATVITTVASASGRYVWNAGSSSFTLTAGQPYYFEVLQKEGTGDDYVSVAWTGPGMTGTNVITGSSIAMALPPGITRQPQSVASTLGGSASFNVLLSSPGLELYQWRLNGVPYWPASGESTLSLANIGGGMAGNYDCVITTPYGMITSAVATLTVSDAGTVAAGGLWREVYNNIGGGNVSDLTGSANFPRLSDSSGVLTNAEATTLGDNYGQRWTGWIKPPTNGNYRFYLAADDSAELWLSLDDTMAHKVKIASLPSWVNSRAWSGGAASALIPLQTGKRYYVELLHKEASGGDHAEFAWQKPGDPVPADGSAPVDGAYFEYRTGGIYSDSYVAPPPLTQNDSFGVPANLESTLNVVANDLDINPASLGLFQVGLPAHGTAAINGQQTVAYMPTPGYAGSDSFAYLITNSSGYAATGSVSVTVMSPTAGLRAWWTFDEAGGATVLDSSGNNYTGTLVGATRTNGALNGALFFNGNSYVTVPPGSCAGLSAQISISLWHYGDPSQPLNSYTITSTDAANNRVFNVHLPWSNGNVYWDCGNSGTSSYDRIYKAAAVSEYEGRWNHWVFTKNAATGEMKMYLNGVLWQSGTGLTRVMSAVVQLRIGAALDGTAGTVGQLDDVRIYDHELSLAEVQTLYAWQPVPGVLLTSPANNSVFPAPATLALAATVTNNGVTINKVQFLNGTNLLNEAVSAPYAFTWTNVPLGSYDLVARVVYNTSNTVDSPSATIAVGAPPTAVADAFAAYAGRATTNDVVANDLDADPASLTVLSVSAPAHGYVSIAGPRLVAYTPADGYLGSDEFTYTVGNGIGLTSVGTVNLLVATVPTYVWRGTNGSNWDLATVNWSYGGAAAVYADGHPVLFDDTSTNGTVNVASQVAPDSITVSNVARAYTFSGLSIGGQGALFKSGSGTLTLSAANNYSGGTVISRGTLRAGNISAAPGVVQLGDASTGGNPVALLYGTGSTPSPNIVVSNQGTGTVTLGTYGGSYATFTGTVSLNRTTTFTDATGDRSTFTGAISGNVGTITIAGGRVTFANAANSFVGNVIINSGSIYQNDSPTALPATTTVIDNGTFRLNNGGVHRMDALSGNGSVLIIAGGAATLGLGNAGGSGNFTGVISDSTAPLSLIKNGTGTQTLSGANTYSGSTTVSNGTLLVNGSLAAASTVTVAGGTLGGNGTIRGATTVAAGGTLAPGPNGIGTLSFTNTLSLGGTVLMEVARNTTVLSNDRLNLSTAVTYAGALVVSNVGATALIAGDSFKLFNAPAYGGSFASVKLPALAPHLVWDTSALLTTGTITVQSGNNLPVAVGDSATLFSGTVATIPVLANDSDADNDPLTIQSVTQGANGVVAIVGTNVTYTPNAGWHGADGFSYTISDGFGTATTNVNVTVTALLVWRGTNTSNWDFTTTNWDNAGQPDTFVDLDTVVFNDSSSVGTINIALPVAPTLATVSNASRAYTFSGSALGGAAALLKRGTGSLTLGSSNSFSGGTTIGAGLVQLNHVNAAGQGAITLGDAGTGASATQLTLNAANITNTITVSTNGTGSATLYATAQFQSNAGLITLNRPTTLQVYNAGGADWWFGFNNITGNVGTLTLVAGTTPSQTRVWLGNSRFTGDLLVQQGRWQVNGGTDIGNTNNVALNSNSDLRLWTGPLVINGLNGPGSIFSDNGSIQSLTVGALGGAGSYSGVISGNVALTKAGAGTQTLAAASTYSGQTIVNAGTLLVTGSLGTGSLVNVNGGTLGGTGTVNGPVLINAGGVLAPGVNGTGVLTVSNLLTLGGTTLMELNKTAAWTNDVIRCSGTVTYGGALVVTNLSASALALGNRFPLFSAPTRSGTFASITYPALAAGLGWTNKLAWDGSIEVVQVVNTTPTNVSYSVSGGQLTLAWPVDHTGWRLEAQTNALSTGLNPAGVWATVPNSTATNQIVIPVDPTTPTVFYRLVYP